MSGFNQGETDTEERRYYNSFSKEMQHILQERHTNYVNRFRCQSVGIIPGKAPKLSVVIPATLQRAQKITRGVMRPTIDGDVDREAPSDSHSHPCKDSAQEDDSDTVTSDNSHDENYVEATALESTDIEGQPRPAKRRRREYTRNKCSVVLFLSTFAKRFFLPFNVLALVVTNIRFGN